MKQKKQLQVLPLSTLIPILFLFLIPSTPFCAETSPESDTYAYSRSYDTTPNDKTSENLTLEEDVPGPGAFLGTLLSSLTRASTSSDSRVKKLIADIPKVLPDLHHVLITL